VTTKTYLLSLPERLVRSVLGLGAGLAREAGDVVLPDRIRKTQLYRTLVDTTLRVLIEQVGGAEGIYPAAQALPDDVMVRRTAGNAIEALGIVAFHASPVWVLAALADVCGAGRQLIPEIAGALKEQQLLDANAEFTSVDQLLDGLEQTSGQLASTFNTPPLDVPALRREWEAIRTAARGLQPNRLPSRDALTSLWGQLRAESVRQERSVFETSSMLAMSALRSLPDRARWVSSSARVGAVKTGQVIATGLLEHYRITLGEIPGCRVRRVRETATGAVRSRRDRSVLAASTDADRAHHRSRKKDPWPVNHRRLRTVYS
jgi:hypothetical protein